MAKPTRRDTQSQDHSRIVEMTEQEIDALIERIEQAIATGMALSTADLQLTLQAIHTLCAVQSQLHNKDATLRKLRGLLDIAAPHSNEPELPELSDEELEAAKERLARKKAAQQKRTRSKKPNAPKVEPRVVHHALTGVEKGQICPACGVGTLAKIAPAVLLRITSHEPFVATKHVNEQVQCRQCGETFTADLPADVQRDGSSTQQYGNSARAMITLNKVGLGTPYYRSEQMSGHVGLKIPSSTAADQISYVARDTQPVFEELERLAAQGTLFLADDTGHRILSETEKLKPDRKTGKTKVRTGVKSSCVISHHPEREPIVLFTTEIGHAGEFLDRVLSQREPGLPPPMLMTDASSQNYVSVTEVQSCLCLAHAYRKFKELQDISEFAKNAVNKLSLTWDNRDTATLEEMNAAQTLELHQNKSYPVLLELKQACEDYLAGEAAEEHSGLGNAVAYFLRHFDGLTAFCRLENAPLDNNECEETLKRIILARKNAYFFKTEKSAGEFSRLLSLIETAKRSGTNLFEYLTDLQSDYSKVIRNMTAYLPWNWKRQDIAEV